MKQLNNPLDFLNATMDDYNKLKKRADTPMPLLIDEDQSQVNKATVLPANYNQLAQDEISDENVDALADAQNKKMIEAAIATPGIVESGKMTQDDFIKSQGGNPLDIRDMTPQERMNKLIEEYQGTRKSADEQAIKDRDFDVKMKLLGTIGGALGNYSNASAQAKIGNPSAKLDTMDLTKVTDIFAREGANRTLNKEKLERMKQEYDMLTQGGRLDTLEMQRARLEFMRQQEEGRDNRAGNRLTFSQKVHEDNQRQRDELTPSQLAEYKSIEDTLNEIERLEVMKSGIATGPIEGRIMQLKQRLRINPAEKSVMIAQLNGILSAYAKKMSGTAVAEPEFIRLQQQLPSPNDSDEAFVANLDRFKTQLEDSRINTLYAFQKSGRNVDALIPKKTIEEKKADLETSIKNPTQASSAPQSKSNATALRQSPVAQTENKNRMVKIQDISTGEKFNIPESDLEEALKDDNIRRL